MSDEFGYVAVPIKARNKGQLKQVEKPIKLDALGERFTRWFNFGSYAIDNSGEEWKTRRHRISPTRIWELWKDPNTAIGLGFGKKTRVAAIDIDAGGQYYNESDLQTICEALESIGIGEQVLIQSSHSGGWHVWFGLPNAIPTFALSCALMEVLAQYGVNVRPGHCEIFPNRKGWTKGEITKYNRVRLPLQPQSGSALLDGDLAPYSQSIKVFLDQLEQSADTCDIDLLLESCAEARANYSPFAKPNGFAPRSRVASEWRKSDLAIIAQPWEPHDSNTRLGVIARYGVVFERLTGDDLVDYIVKTATNTPGYSKHCRHQGEIKAWASRWGRCAEGKYYAYEPKKQTKPAGPSNDERQQAATERLIGAMAKLRAEGELPNGVKARETVLVDLAGISKSTLWKPRYKALWHPKWVSDKSPNTPPLKHSPSIRSASPHPPTITVWGRLREILAARGLLQPPTRWRAGEGASALAVQ
ncbi:hypothetical protein IQ217_14850 [Synechocystis salina LEGE 00031]|uniref:Uncharacterized protein n=2 Tax=Synechocystis TaxID=1142 RepID=A0ABR9VXW8_9SYNC|nr:hypothetical protein [Synechocystis salina]MBE9255096.1 hypothetical protein [Synechocystis salina LEGE 00031]